jgi:hypothetical protein
MVSRLLRSRNQGVQRHALCQCRLALLYVILDENAAGFEMLLAEFLEQWYQWLKHAGGTPICEAGGHIIHSATLQATCIPSA